MLQISTKSTTQFLSNSCFKNGTQKHIKMFKSSQFKLIAIHIVELNIAKKYLVYAQAKSLRRLNIWLAYDKRPVVSRSIVAAPTPLHIVRHQQPTG